MSGQELDGGWTLSWHAAQAMQRRGFEAADVARACTDPELAYSSYQYGEGRWVHKYGNVAVALHRPSRTVITVLLRSGQEWTDLDARAVTRPPVGVLPSGTEASPERQRRAAG